MILDEAILRTSRRRTRHGLRPLLELRAEVVPKVAILFFFISTGIYSAGLSPMIYQLRTQGHTSFSILHPIFTLASHTQPAMTIKLYG
jgi:hypothetical protein